jgi:uncharacterized BrkB/YihY/UPF0761 family membrane protein
MMKRVVGIFFILTSLLTYLIMEVLYYPTEEKQTKIDMNTGISTVKVTLHYPLMYWVICVLLIITCILGIYFILVKEKQP